MTMIEMLLVIFFFIPLGVLALMFIVGVTYLQVKEECR